MAFNDLVFVVKYFFAIWAIVVAVGCTRSVMEAFSALQHLCINQEINPVECQLVYVKSPDFVIFLFF